jgi:hypothetical protein
MLFLSNSQRHHTGDVTQNSKMTKQFYFLILITLLILSCNSGDHQNKNIDQDMFLLNELETISSKSQWKYLDIKLASSQYPERYFQVFKHSEIIKRKVNLLDSLIQIDNKNEFESEFDLLKKEINNSKLYRGSLIFDYMKNRFHFLNTPDFSNPAILRWHLINLGYELQEYLAETLNDNFYIFSSVSPITIDDSLIYLASTDTNRSQNIKIWDINKSKKYAIEKPDDSLILEVKIEDGVGKISGKQLAQFPNGYQGFFVVKNKRGDGGYYWFKNK